MITNQPWRAEGREENIALCGNTLKH